MSLQHSSDRRLWERFLDGDDIAFEAIYKTYSSSLLRWLFSLFPQNPEVAEELTADVFIGLWEKRSQLPVPDNVKAFLFKSAKNRLISFLRKSEHYTQGFSQSIEELMDQGIEFTIGGSNPEMFQISSEELDAAIHLIGKLPPRTGHVFRLHRVEGFTYDEIAQILDISVSGVEKHIMRAMFIITGLKVSG